MQATEHTLAVALAELLYGRVFENKESSDFNDQEFQEVTVGDKVVARSKVCRMLCGT